jgi:hypothetical protein
MTADRLRRTAGRREPRESFAVYCEGRVTEKSYLLNLKRELRASNVFIQWVPGTPLDVVKRAEQDGRSADAVVWCVFDAEAPRLHPNFEQAMARAARNSFNSTTCTATPSPSASGTRLPECGDLSTPCSPPPVGRCRAVVRCEPYFLWKARHGYVRLP